MAAKREQKKNWQASKEMAWQANKKKKNIVVKCISISSGGCDGINRNRRSFVFSMTFANSAREIL